MKIGILVILIYIFTLPINTLTAKINQPDTSSLLMKADSSLLNVKRDKIEQLELLGYVWTLLKYCHPINSTSSIDWDYELFKIIPNIVKSKNNIETEKEISLWVNDLNLQSPIPISNVDANYSYPSDILNQLKSYVKSDELRSNLRAIYASQNMAENKYIVFYSGIPLFKEYNNYDYVYQTSSTVRLLALYRYWGAINYFFPYKYLINKNWSDVLKNMIPHFILAKNDDEYKLAIAMLTEQVGDSHAYFNMASTYNKKWGANTTSAILKFIENKPIVVGFRDDENRGGLKKGDIVKSINETSTKQLKRYYNRYISASNNDGKLRNIAYYMMRTTDSVLLVKIDRDGKPFELSVPAPYNFSINYLAIKEQKEPLKVIDSILYIYPQSNPDNVRLALTNSNEYRALIIDMRCYPSMGDDGIMELLGGDSVTFIKFTQIDTKKIGSTKSIEEYKTGGEREKWYDKTMVILVNEHTQSMAEFIVMELQVFPNSVTIGSQTAGADGNVTQIELPGGYFGKFSSIGVYYPDGGETQRVGVRIDEIVKPTIKGIREGRDEVLERAIEIINSK